VTIQALLSDAVGGHRLTEAECVRLLGATGRDVLAIAAAADEVREARVGDRVTYVRNQNLHITNICKNVCGFCGFGRPPGAHGTYLFGKEEIQRKARLAAEREVTEICPLSGVHPDFTIESYVNLIVWIHEVAPAVDVHTCSPEEVSFVAGKAGLSTVEVLARMREAGLGTLQGTAAEILVDEVRRVICPRKCDTATWLRVIREAHAMGIRSTATIMYGAGETVADRVRHLALLREVQDEHGGFTELVPLSYIHQNTALYRAGIAPAGATGREDLLLCAVARLFLDNFDHIQVSWGKVGPKMASVMLLAGGDDLGGTMFEDEVTVDAGAEEASYMDPALMARIATDLDRRLWQRSTTYDLLREEPPV
jgi:FO synthase subunit 2